MSCAEIGVNSVYVFSKSFMHNDVEVEGFHERWAGFSLVMTLKGTICTVFTVRTGMCYQITVRVSAHSSLLLHISTVLVSNVVLQLLKNEYALVYVRVHVYTLYASVARWRHSDEAESPTCVVKP